VNIISAVLDNATLASAEISAKMSLLQVKSVLMGLLISGGMMIPGNIPNIVSADKLKIRSSEWAKFGIPFGLVVMVVYYIILFYI
jgi:predicted cation transporter